MKIRRAAHRGFTLFELIVASAMMTAVVTAAGLLLRGGNLAWQAHESDLKLLESAHATLRHVVRQARQAQSVSAISVPATTSGNLSLLMASGQTLAWGHNSGAKTALYGVTTATNILADGISEFRFAGYEADGVTQTNVASDVQLIKCTVRVDLTRTSGSVRNISTWAWVRCW